MSKPAIKFLKNHNKMNTRPRETLNTAAKKGAAEYNFSSNDGLEERASYVPLMADLRSNDSAEKKKQKKRKKKKPDTAKVQDPLDE